jgi:hypothetical protein
VKQVNASPFYGIAIFSSLFFAGCSHSSGSDASQAASSGGDRPPIHFDQTAVLMTDGQPTEQNSYMTLLAGCQKSGRPMHALTQAEVGKIGRLHVESWIGPDKTSRHEEEWHLESPAPCQFALTHKDHTEIVDAKGRSTMIDNTTHTADVQETGEPSPMGALPENDGAMDDAANKAGWSKKADAMANGVPCAVWQNALGFEACVWSGGRAWGYSSYGVDALKDGMSDGQSIVLWAHPGKGAAWQLETRTFSVGQPLDSNAFAIPANVTTRNASP